MQLKTDSLYYIKQIAACKISLKTAIILSHQHLLLLLLHLLHIKTVGVCFGRRNRLI